MTQEEQVGKRLCELLGGQHCQIELFAEYCQVVETGRPLVKESFLCLNIFGGQSLIRFYDIHVTKLEDGFVASWRDVTEKKQAEAQKVLLEQANLLEQVHEAIFVRDANSVITSWNRAAEQMYAWTKAEAQGNVSHALLKTQFPAECTNLDTILWQEGHWEGELIHTRQDGMQIVVESRQVLVRDRRGVPVGILEVNRDVTERKQVEEALRSSEATARQRLAEIEAIYTTAPIGLCFVDTDLRYIRINDHMAEIDGVPVSEHIGRTIGEVLPELVETLEPLHRQVIQSGLPILNYEIHVATPAQPGIERDWLASYYPLKDINGRVLGVNTVVQEITESKRQEALLQQKNEELAQADRIKDEFLAITSHELRSPLNPILGWSKLLQSGKLSQVKTAEALAIIERNAKLQTQLIEDLLDVSRILRGKISLNVSPVNLESTIAAAIETVRLAAQAKSIQLTTVFDANVGQVEGDPNRLQQIVWNLLSNAVKFTPNGGRVEVRLSQVGTQAQIQVIDTCKGISLDFLPCIFDYFRQEDSTITRKFGGLGLGLAIVQQLVELHGGTIAAASLGEGMGATFTVWLPLLERKDKEDKGDRSQELGVRSQELGIRSQMSEEIHHASAPSASSVPSIPPSPETLPSPLAGIRVLVVDDEVDSREVVAFILEEHGAVVTVAASAGEALQVLAKSQLDVLVSDIGMPEVDGYMLIRQVRAMPQEQGGQILAIALTGYAGKFNQQQALRAGFQMHIPKPVELAQLVAAIASLVGEN